jgi:uncharacterized coiled-coil protein SlyX
MFGFSKRTATQCAGCVALADTLEATRREVTTLRHDVDELMHRFRRYQGRVAKESALDQAVGDPPPTPTRRHLRAIPAGEGGAPLPTLSELRRNGRLPW